MDFIWKFFLASLVGGIVIGVLAPEFFQLMLSTTDHPIARFWPFALVGIISMAVIKVVYKYFAED